MGNHGPGYQKHPDHRVATVPVTDRVRVTFDGEVIADTRDAILLEETGYDPVYYLPRRDVKMERLVGSDAKTHCPFKGVASYFSLRGARTVLDAVWSYEAPYDEVEIIKDRLAFYPSKVDSIAIAPAA